MKIVCVQDFRINAKAILSPAIFTYIDTGAEQSKTRNENWRAFDKILIIPRVLVSTENTDLTTTIFSHQLSLPIGFAPSLNHTLVHKDGQLIGGYIAGKKNICYTQSIYGGKRLSEICQRNDQAYKQQMGDGKGFRLFQIYVSAQWDKTLKTIDLAEKNGFIGLVITVDTQVIGVRHGQQHNFIDFSKYKFGVLDQITDGNIKGRDAYRKNRDLRMNWKTIKKIRSLTKMKIILKGVTHPQDAKIAAQENMCDAIWVSNHGGRQLDTVQPTIELLPRIKAVIGNKMPIFVDGGVRNGTDIFKCLAFGADLVFIGRPVMYSMVNGLEGVQQMVDILHEELNRTLVLSGVKSLQQINPTFLKHAPLL